MQKRSFVTALAVCSLASIGWADTLVTRSGAVHQGRLLSATQNVVNFQENGRRVSFNKRDVQSIQFDTTQAGNAAAPYGNQQYTGTGYGQAGNAAAQTAGTREIPSGTDLQIRTNEAIDATNATEGRAYSATVAQDVMDASGNVVVPRGSNAELVVRNVSNGNLALDVQSVNVNGTRYLVNTADVQRNRSAGIGANKRTGEYVGGGALVGTIIGAIAGGGKGAAIGAITGAAAGAGAQVLTRGKEVKVPAETLLTFQLQQPVYLQPR